MLEYLIDDLVIWAYRNELLKDYEKRYVYEYAIQVILYNMMLLVVTFLISVFTNNIQSFIMFMIFFVMLRRNLGGFHFKNKYICMTVSISMYVIITFFGGEIFLLYENYILVIWGVLAILCLFMPALKDKNYNKKVVNIEKYKELKIGEFFYIDNNGKGALLFKFLGMQKGKMLGEDPINSTKSLIATSLYVGKVKDLV